MQKIFLAFILIMIISFFACKGHKKVVNLDQLKPLKKTKLLDMLEDAAIHPEWLYSKGQVHFKDNRISIGLTFSSILRKDSIFVMSVKKIGMVVGKIKITPDSVIILNPLQKNWMGGSLEEIANRFGVPPKFSIIQDMILGNPMFITRQNATSQIEDKKYKYTAYDQYWLNAFWIDPINERLTKQYLKDNIYKQRIIQKLDNYKEAENGTLFSFLRNLELHTQQAGQIDIKITTKKLVWNQPRDIHFSIPSHYSNVE